MTRETKGMLYGLLGVGAFSLTLPMTRLAVTGLGPLTVGLGRALVAAVFALLLLLLLTRSPRPSRAQLPGLIMVALGVIVGFPLLSSLAMQQVPASHGTVVVGLLPLATALAGVLRAGERPAVRFWVFSLLGTGLVVGYVLWSGGGKPQPADGWLLGAVGAAALGYAEGGRLARQMGGWQVICWALLLVVPALLWPVGWSISNYGLHATPAAWGGIACVSAVSMFLGLFAWYHGLALGGIARVGQIQLLQPFLTMLASALVLGEKLALDTLLVAALVLGVVAFGRRSAGTVVSSPHQTPYPTTA